MSFSRDRDQLHHDPTHPWPAFRSCDDAAGTSARASETGCDLRAPLTFDSVADPPGATRARRVFANWLAIDVEDPHRQDIVLAVYEALANAAEHAYADHPDEAGTMCLTAHRGPDHVRITVADRGHWRAPTEAPFRSRSLELMRALMSQVHLHSYPHGTIVQLRSAVPTSPRTATG